MSNYKQNKIIRKQGFTLVEMLIVAPIIVLVIGIFVSTIVGVTGDVLAARGTSSLSYSIQDALDRISKDVEVSGGYLSTNNITLSTGQGYDNSTSDFHNATTDLAVGPMLILNTYATTLNPSSATQSYVYKTNQPNACSTSTTNQNSKIMMNVVYFVKNNALWRRVIAPADYATVGCSVPWQLPSCEPGYSATFCKANDSKLVEGIQTNGFSVDYFPAGSTTANTIASNGSLPDDARYIAMRTTNTVKVTISATKTIAGRDVSQTGSVRTISPNDVSTVKVLVVAGGGGGNGGVSGVNYGNGGGGGTVKYQPIYNLTPGYKTVTVGSGGIGVITGTGGSGNNSLFDTLVATGGTGTINTSRTGGANANYTGGTASIGTNSGAGAGGGANGSVSTAGNGYQSSIRGTATYYAGGGGAIVSSVGQAGGLGGGGAGAATGGGINGTANTGGGGGGGDSSNAGGYGGSGIVIISYPTGSISATGGTVSYSGGYTIHTFTSSGTFVVS